MPEFGFPAQPHRQSAADMISRLRDNADGARTEAVTGRANDAARELSGQIGPALEIEKSILDLQQYANAISLSEVRAGATQSALERIVDATQDLASNATLYQTTGVGRNGATLAEQGRGAIADIVSALNTSVGGRAVFGGDDAGSAPLIDADQIYDTIVPLIETAGTSAAVRTALDQAFYGPGTLFETNFYQGGTGDAPITEIAPGVEVAFAIRADETLLRGVLRNVIAVTAAIDPETTLSDDQRQVIFDEAVADMRTSIGDVIGIRSQLGVAEQRIATVKARNIANEAALSITYNELTGVDQYLAALTLKDIEGQLETAFATTARLSNLSLVNYL